jgi:hypothetical protein
MKYMDCRKCGKTLINLLPGLTDKPCQVEGHQVYGMFWCDDCGASYIATEVGVIEE